MADERVSTMQTGRPDPLTASTATDLVAQLKALRLWAGRPSYRTLRDLAGVRPGSGDPPLEALPTSTTHEILTGKRLPRLPRLDFVEAYVAACLRAGRCPPAEIDAEVERWRQGWRELAGTGDVISVGADAAGLNAAPPSRPGTGPAERADQVVNQRIGWLRRPPRRLVQAVVAVVLLTGGAVIGGAVDRYLSGRPADSHAGPGNTLNNLVFNGTFTRQVEPWWTHGPVPMRLERGQALVPVHGGTAKAWDEMVGQSGISLRKDHTYTLTFDVSADARRTFRVLVQTEKPPYTQVFGEDIPVTPLAAAGRQQHAFRFTSFLTTYEGQVVFQFGGPGPGYTVRLDNVSLVEHPQ